MKPLLMSNPELNIIDKIMAGEKESSQTKTVETRVPVKCDKIQKEQAELFVKTETARAKGIYNLSDFITLCVREGLKKYAKDPETPYRLFIPNSKNHLLDLDLDIYKNEIVCAKCDSNSCVHIQSIQQDKQVQKYIRDFLKSKGRK